MDNNRKLIYSREQKGLDLKPEIKAGIESSETDLNTQISSSFSLKGYEKKDGMFSYSLFCVISGGEKKEKNFLRELIIHRNLRSLRVAFLSKENQGLQPYQMQDIWSEIRRSGIFEFEGQSFRLDSVDKVYLLSDVDEFYDQLVKILCNQDENDVGEWIISNPCFEIWLYYCFKNEPKVDLVCLESLSTAERSQKMKELGNVVVDGGLNPIHAFERMANGISHSIKHYARDDKNIPILYATEMHKMAQCLLETMNRSTREYDEFIRSKREWRETMRSGK